MQPSSSPHRPKRLVTREAFVRVQGQGRRFRGAHLCMLVQRTPTCQTAVGFTVSKRVGNAVVRNSVRRRLKEIVRLDRDQVLPESEIVIIAFPSAAGADYADLRAELLCLFDKARRSAQQQPFSSASSRCTA